MPSTHVHKMYQQSATKLPIFRKVHPLPLLPSPLFRMCMHIKTKANKNKPFMIPQVSHWIINIWYINESNDIQFKHYNKSTVWTTWSYTCNYIIIPYGGSMSKMKAYRRGCSWILLNVCAASSGDIYFTCTKTEESHRTRCFWDAADQKDSIRCSFLWKICFF